MASNDEIDKLAAEAMATFTSMLTKDFMGAAIAGSDRLMGIMRGELHEQLDKLLNLTQQRAANCRRDAGMKD